MNSNSDAAVSKPKMPKIPQMPQMAQMPQMPQMAQMGYPRNDSKKSATKWKKSSRISSLGLRVPPQSSGTFTCQVTPKKG